MGDSFKKSTRRKMTENRISRNIMKHNSPTEILDPSAMQVSPKF